MRKVLVLIMVVLLGVTSFALVGCDNTGKAKEAMKEADDAWAKVNTQMTQMQNTLTEVIGPLMSGDTSALTSNLEAINQAGAQIDAVTKELENTEKLYDDLANLNVGGYTEYADAMVKAINATIDALTLGKELYAKVMPVIQTGDAAQIMAFFQQNTALLTQAQTAQQEVQAAIDAATKIKTDKKLGQ
jgi:DNA repair exonuclease SbcCD ATPase subunit